MDEGAMAEISQFTVRNRLLRTLSPEDFGLLRPHLAPVAIDRSDVLIEANEPIEHIHFPEAGIASIVANTEDGRRIEVGVYGREGMSGTAVLLGADRTPHENFYQVAGSALTMSSDDLRAALRRSPSLQGLLLRYVQAFQVQTAYTALSNGGYSIEERLARWLLMCHDRIDGDELPLTHEFLGIMLGVRRSSVTLATQVLEGAQVIEARRGRLKILNRAKLEEIAGDSYGPPEAEYARLIGRPGDGSGVVTAELRGWEQG
jgi:CRP-like cAMP-binding protein